MSRNKLLKFERMIILTFPIVLFVGCAGSGEFKPGGTDLGQSNQATYEENETIELHPAFRPVEESDTDSWKNSIGDTSADSETVTLEVSIPENISAPVASASILPVNNIYYFDTDKFEITEAMKEQLQLHAKYLLANPGTRLVINGHADERGTESYNQVLSEKRADAVHEILVNLGVPEQQLARYGHGESLPLSNAFAWDENRRVELDYEAPVVLSEK